MRTRMHARAHTMFSYTVYWHAQSPVTLLYFLAGLHCQLKLYNLTNKVIKHFWNCNHSRENSLALVSKILKNKRFYKCMLITTNLFVANPLKHLKSCQFTGSWFAPNSLHARTKRAWKEGLIRLLKKWLPYRGSKVMIANQKLWLLSLQQFYSGYFAINMLIFVKQQSMK